MRPITRRPQLTEKQVRELEDTGETEARLEKAPWYYPLMEHSAKFLLAACAGMALFIFNSMQESDDRQAKATEKLVQIMQGVENEQIKLRTQFEAMTESMRALSSRQDSAIATAERAVSDIAGLRSRVELLQYYVLEFDGKLIGQGVVKPSDSVALKLRKEQERKP